MVLVVVLVKKYRIGQGYIYGFHTTLKSENHIMGIVKTHISCHINFFKATFIQHVPISTKPCRAGEVIDLYQHRDNDVWFLTTLRYFTITVMLWTIRYVKSNITIYYV